MIAGEFFLKLLLILITIAQENVQDIAEEMAINILECNTENNVSVVRTLLSELANQGIEDAITCVLAIRTSDVEGHGL